MTKKKRRSVNLPTRRKEKGMGEIVAQRTFNVLYIWLDAAFIAAFCLLLFFTKRRMTLLFALAGGVLYFLVDFLIFHLLTGSRHLSGVENEGVGLFWVLLWMSLSYGITNFAWIWLCLKKDKRIVEWTILIFVWWVACPMLADTFGAGLDKLQIWRETGAYHGYMAIILFVSYAAVIVWNLLHTDKAERFRILWLFGIGVAVQFGWEFSLLIGGIRSFGLAGLEEKLHVLIVNSLVETNLGLPAIYCIYLWLSRFFTEDCKKRTPPLKFMECLKANNEDRYREAKKA